MKKLFTLSFILMQVQFNLIVMHEFSILLFTKKLKSMSKLSLRFSLNSRFFFDSVCFSQYRQVVSRHRCVLAPPAAKMVKHMRQHSETSWTGVWHCRPCSPSERCCRQEAAPRPSPVWSLSGLCLHLLPCSFVSLLLQSEGLKPDDFTWEAFQKFLDSLCLRPEIQSIFEEMYVGSTWAMALTLVRWNTLL